jgi:hypothetical protein
MARPWRIEFEGALYHVLSRGNEQRDNYRDRGSARSLDIMIDTHNMKGL